MPRHQLVQIKDRRFLQHEADHRFVIHHSPRKEQLDYANKISPIEESMMYHGGTLVFRLADVPGLWREDCVILLTTTLECPDCHAKYRVPQMIKSIRATCPSCKAKTVIPAQQTEQGAAANP